MLNAVRADVPAASRRLHRLTAVLGKLHWSKANFEYMVNPYLQVCRRHNLWQSSAIAIRAPDAVAGLTRSRGGRRQRLPCERVAAAQPQATPSSCVK